MAAITPALIVPINVQALSLSQDGIDKYPTAPAAGRVDYSQLPSLGAPSWGSTQAAIASTVDTSQKTGSFLPGVQLHWALPGAMTTQGDWTQFMAPPNEENPPTVSMLPAPDQWFVVRIANGQPAGDLSTWVVDSGFLGQNAPEGLKAAAIPTNLPTLEGSESPYAYLGQTTIGANWKNPSDSQCVIPLTAAGRGQASFAAYLPDCVNVFGMYDAVPPSTSGPLSYLVVGWYRNPALTDPLAIKPRTVADLATLNWTLPINLPADTPLPGLTLFAGYISSVTANSTPVQTNPTTSVALGVNPPSALSALLAAMDENQVSGFARALTALIYGKLDLAERADATALIDNLLHRVGFTGVKGADVSAVHIEEKTKGAASNPNLPDDVVSALLTTNAAELISHRLQRSFATLRTQLFWDWQNYIMNLCANGNDEPTSYYPMMSALNGSGVWGNPAKLNSSQVLLNASSAVQSQQQQVTDCQINLQNACSGLKATADGPGVEYHVVKRPLSTFLAPLDPAFALSGDGLNGPDRIGNSVPGNSTPLTVRFSSSIIGILSLGANIANASQACSVLGSQYTVPQTNLPLPISSLPHLDVVQALFAEGCLVDPANATVLAQGLGNGVQANALQSLLQSVVASDQAPDGVTFGDQNSALTSPPPDPALTYWTQNPWIPVFLRWSAQITPIGGSTDSTNPALNPEAIVSNFTLASGDTDLIPNQTVSVGVTSTLIGLGTLSTSVSDRMASMLKAAAQTLDTVTAANLQTIGDALAATPIHTGHLEGFYHQALQLQRQPQLPVVDLMNATNSSGADPTLLQFTQTVAGLAQGQTALGLQAQSIPSLSPIVSGSVSNVSLVVVDCFGQTLGLTPTQPITTDDVFTAPSWLMTNSTEFYLPPRVACPTRLLARWVAPVPGSTVLDNPAQPAVNPIRGWLLAVPANSAFLLYAADGGPLLEIYGGASTVTYTPTPGSPIQSGGSGSAALTSALAAANVDPVLTAFVGQVATLAPDALAGFITLLDQMAAESAPDGSLLNPAVAALIGRPLAVVQAAVAFELEGPPPPDQSPNGFATFVSTMNGTKTSNTAIPVRDSANLLNVQFPLLVGDDGMDNDGLYAYSVDNTGSIYVASTGPLPAGCAAASPAPVTLTVTDTENPTLLTMLVDPTAPVHLAMGILPVATLSIPSAFYQYALASLTATIATGPLLTSLPISTNFSTIPPGVGQGDWTWSQRQIVGGETVWTPGVPLQPLDGGSLLTIGTPGLVEGWLSLQVSKVAAKGRS